MKTISVIIISYNQEDTISRCLDSILCQSEHGLKEIVVCDDCSKDRTWEILQFYRGHYPDIVRVYRNEKNLGIYANSQKALSLRGEADLYHQLAGDDALCDGWFDEIQKYASQNSIDMSIPIGIYCDWKMIDPRGKEIIFKQNKIAKGFSPYSLYLRGMACNRSLLVNNEVLKRYLPVVLDRGLRLAESIYDSQDHLIVEKAFYVPFVASIYYCQKGISLVLKDIEPDYRTEQVITTCQYHISHFVTDKRDEYYENYCIELVKYNQKPTVNSFIKVICFFYKGKIKGMKYSLNDYWNGFRPLLHPLASILRIVN